MTVRRAEGVGVNGGDTDSVPAVTILTSRFTCRRPQRQAQHTATDRSRRGSSPHHRTRPTTSAADSATRRAPRPSSRSPPARRRPRAVGRSQSAPVSGDTSHPEPDALAPTTRVEEDNGVERIGLRDCRLTSACGVIASSRSPGHGQARLRRARPAHGPREEPHDRRGADRATGPRASVTTGTQRVSPARTTPPSTRPIVISSRPRARGGDDEDQDEHPGRSRQLPVLVHPARPSRPGKRKEATMKTKTHTQAGAAHAGR
jgi:hypothetical protein